LKWIKYRKTFAWGNEEWLYKPLFNLDEWDEEEFVEEIHSSYSWSDKYRGVEFDLVETSDIPKNKIKYLIKMASNHLDLLEEEKKDAKAVIKILKEYDK
jgi:hypothetical protein